MSHNWGAKGASCKARRIIPVKTPCNGKFVGGTAAPAGNWWVGAMKLIDPIFQGGGQLERYLKCVGPEGAWWKSSQRGFV